MLRASRTLVVWFIAACSSLATAAIEPEAIKVGLVTDVHYADVATRGTREYRDSIPKVREAVKVFKAEKIRALIELGDLIDTGEPVKREFQMQYERTILDELRKCGAPVKCVLGNHCVWGMSKEDFLGVARQKRSYLSFDLGQWHFVLLDADFTRAGVPYNAGNAEWTDTDVPREEREWLRQDLAKTKKRALVFIHQRMDLEKGQSQTIASCEEVRAILEGSKKVAAVFQGHAHEDEVKRINGIPYLTLSAMVDGPGVENNAFSVLILQPDGSIELRGYGKHAKHPAAGKL